MTRVLGTGLMAIDHIWYVQGNSLKNSKPEYLGSSGGGSVGNTLCMLSLLGHKTSSFGVIGNDLAGSLLKKDFQQFGVDTRLLATHGSSKNLRRTRQFSHLIFADGHHDYRLECLKCHSPFKREIQISDLDLTKKTLESAKEMDCLHLDRANSVTVRLAQEFKDRGLRISFDYAYETRRGGSKWSNEILNLADLVKVSEGVIHRRMGRLEQDTISKLQREFPDISFLFITRGEEGVFGYGETTAGRLSLNLPALVCEHNRDAAGAGDIFMALAVSELLKKTLPEDQAELAHRVDLAQSLAALSCTMYGARSLQRFLLTQKVTPSGTMKMAEEMIIARKVGNSISPRLGLPPPLSQPFRFSLESSCDICGAAKVRRAKRNGIKEQKVYVRDLSTARDVMHHSFEMGLASRDLLHDFGKDSMILVGSGGSLVSASFGEQLILRTRGLTSKAIAPFDFQNIKTLSKETEVCFLSYGGENPDIMGAAKHASSIGHKKCFLITGTKNATLTRFAHDHNWPVINLMCQDRGFVTTVGMLGMVSTLAGLFTGEDSLAPVKEFFDYNNLYRFFNAAERLARNEAALFPQHLDSAHLVALASGWGWPALVDLESKIVEGGICTIETSELKNFTHGRYINSFYHRKNRHFIMFGTPDESELVRYFNRRLSRYFEITLLETDREGLVGALELLVQELFLAFFLGERAGRDLSKPKYPREARGLYSWRPQERDRS